MEMQISTLQEIFIGIKIDQFKQGLLFALLSQNCHPQDSNSLNHNPFGSGNPLGNVGIHFLAPSHDCGVWMCLNPRMCSQTIIFVMP